MTHLIRRRNPLTAALLGLCLVAVGCGAPSVDDAIAELQASYNGGSYEAVVAAAPALAERCNSEGAGELKAWKVEKLGVLSLGKLGKGEDAAKALDRLDGAFSGKVKPELYGEIGGYVTDSGNYTEAITVLDAGAKKYPEKSALFTPFIDSCKTAATQAGDSAAIEKLKSLGYL